MPDPYTCAFCTTAADLALCRFPVIGRVRVPIAEVVVGDVVLLFKRDSPEPEEGRVTEIEIRKTGYRYRIWVQVGKRKPKRLSVSKEAHAQAMRPTTCQARCCPLHRCERAEETIYCQDHWRLPEIVGGTPAPLPLPDPLRSRTALRAEQQIAKASR